MNKEKLWSGTSRYEGELFVVWFSKTIPICGVRLVQTIHFRIVGPFRLLSKLSISWERC